MDIRNAVLLVMTVSAAAASCATPKECSWDTDCPGRMICTGEGTCIEPNAGPARGGDGGPSDTGARTDAGRPPEDGGGDSGTADTHPPDAGPADAGGADDVWGDAGVDASGDAGDAGPSCGEPCTTAGQRVCDGDSWRECAQNDACLVWGSPSPCAWGEVCRGDGVCGKDECKPGQTRCEDQTYQSDCEMTDGFYVWGAKHVCPANGSCIGDRCCPAGMASAPGFCVDIYEASIADSITCQGKLYNQNGDDLPAGFPDNVGEGGGTETAPMYACSLGLVTPASLVTYYQAGRACTNAGKRLCTQKEWSTACAGPNGYRWPYGNTYNNVNCNTTSGRVQNTGVNNACVSGYGAFDTSGNLWEWISAAGGRSPSNVAGGDYQSFLNSSCTQLKSNAPLAPASNIGFRCCR